MNEQSRTPAMTRRHRLVLGAVLLGLAIGARGELPLEEPPPDTPPPEPPHGIVVPVPAEPRGEGNIDELPAAPANPQPNALQPFIPKHEFLREAAPPLATDFILPDLAAAATDQRVTGTGPGCRGWLPGKLLEADAASVGWELPNVPQPVRFQGRGLACVKLAPAATPLPPAVTSWIVRLTNGDLLAGNDLTLDATHLALTVPGAGPLRLPRPEVAALFRAPPPAAAWRRWQDLTAWEQIVVQTGWPTGQKSKLPLALYQDLAVPDCAEIEVRSGAPAGLLGDGSKQFALALYADANIGGEAKSLTIRLSRTDLYLTAARNDGLLEERVPLRDAPAGAWRTLVVRVNRRTRNLLLLVDGQTLYRGKVPVAAATATARGIVIPWAGGAGLFRLGDRLLVTPLPDEVELEAAAQPGRVLLANGDSAAGQLVAFDPHGLTLAAPDGRLELPAERLAGAWLATRADPTAAHPPGDVTVSLRDGQEWSGKLTAVTADRVTLETRWGGALTMPRAAVAEWRWHSAPPPNTECLGSLTLDQEPPLPGTLAGFTADTVSWRLPAVAEPVKLPRARARWATTGRAFASATPAPTSLRLANGDRLRGELRGADGQGVQLAPADLPPLSVPAAQIVSLWPGAAPELALVPGIPRAAPPGGAAPVAPTATPAGGYALDHTRGWHYAGALPPRLAVHLEVLQEEVAARAHLLTVSAFASPNGLGASPAQASFTIFNTAGGPDGHLAMPSLAPALAISPLRVAASPRQVLSLVWLVDRPRNEAWLLVNGQSFGPCRGSAPLDERGPLVFQKTNLIEERRLRQVVLSEWRGAVELLGQATPADAVTVWRYDLTCLTGPLARIAAGQVVLANVPAGVPLAEVARIDYRSPATKPVPATAGDVWVRLPDGDHLTLTDPAHDGTRLSGTHPALGHLTLPAAAIVRLDFQPAGAPATEKKP